MTGMLLQIGGPPGVGKSTLARRLHEMIPNSMLVSTDLERKSTPAAWFMNPDGSLDSTSRMRHAHTSAVGKTGAHLASGCSVIVDTLHYQSDWMAYWETVAQRAGAVFLDFYLAAPRETVLNRALKRGFSPQGRLNLQKVGYLYDITNAFYSKRPQTNMIDALVSSEGMALQVMKVVSVRSLTAASRNASIHSASLT